MILLDIAENYKFVIQDEVQSCHWHQQSCTLHPVVIYYIKDGKIREEPICIISDDLIHDTSFVHQVIDMTISYIKEQLKLEMKKIHYFSDGWLGSTKTSKIFKCLLTTKRLFGELQLVFFATCHGKAHVMALVAQ